MPQTGKQMYDEMVKETARMMAEQDAAQRPAEALLSKAEEIVKHQIRQGIYADPRAKYDIAGLINSMRD